MNNNFKYKKNINIIKDGKCSYCFTPIEKKYTSCFMCNKKRKKDLPIIPNCSDCGITKDSIFKYCIECYEKHKNDYKNKLIKSKIN
tara:strand:+ start:165 stop:422 length:258 start_codon:yes stop_codon:yes gene_type:complete